MKKRLTLMSSVVAAVALVPVVGAHAMYAPEPGGYGGYQQVLPGDPGGKAGLKKVHKKAHKKAQVKLPYLGRH